jgi:hypothetical protein
MQKHGEPVIPDAYKRQVESVVLLRQRLVEVEVRRGQQDKNIPPETWQEFLDVSRKLEQAEETIRQISREIISEVNQVRGKIKSALEEYNHWREQMRQVESLFLANIVRPGHHLKAAIRQREYLQQEYQRLLAGVQQEKYASQQELEAELRLVLSRGDLAEEAATEEQEQEELWEEDPFKKIQEMSVDDLVEVFTREELIREFKRVVLPKIHPDTSNAPPEEFKTVFEVYKKGDPLLMEAYIVEYRGEILAEKEGDVLENLAGVLKTRAYILRLFGRLQRRVELLKQEMSPQELEDPGKIQENMKVQRQEILVRIQAEAEQILYWREKIESLVEQYQQHRGQGENDR